MVDFEMAPRIRGILDRIASAAERSGRRAEDVRLVAVSKTKPVEMIVEAAKTGLVSHFGENRVQECQAKVPAFPADMAVCWHLIGHLQRNKARKAVDLVDVIESVDSLEIAATLERLCAEKGKNIKVLVEVNSSAEAAKTGLPMDQVPALAEYLREKCPHLDFKGLMTIGPLGGDEKAVRSAFAATRELRDKLRVAPDDLPCLSMGMSGDFQWAVEEGSTEVRVGTAIFGQR
ncbi:MAG: YggS family pyridoxal phosphate-dependent enzyme [Pyramidobacter sp.]|jgi:pyridoxal phosphate enzyme (YggS family)